MCLFVSGVEIKASYYHTAQPIDHKSMALQNALSVSLQQQFEDCCAARLSDQLWSCAARSAFKLIREKTLGRTREYLRSGQSLYSQRHPVGLRNYTRAVTDYETIKTGPVKGTDGL